MLNRFKVLLIITLLGLAAVPVIFFVRNTGERTAVFETTYETTTSQESTTSASIPSTSVITSKTLNTNYHVFQTFNNCGPASLSMALSYYDINVSQKELGDALRPFQNQQGDNDDKSVTLEEMAVKAQEYGLLTYHRPNGNMDVIKEFIRNDIPVVARTWLKENEDIGHYRVIKGFSEKTGEIIQDDSYDGKNLVFSIDKFNKLWEAFNYEYLVLVPKDKKEIAEKILGPNLDETYSWEQSKKISLKQLEQNPNNHYARFNLAVAAYYLGDYNTTIVEYEKVKDKLPKRMLWYQIEPILAHQKLKNYDQVFRMTDEILNNGNRAFSELYIIRGEIYKEQGNNVAAQSEFEKARIYNKNIKIPT